MEFFFYKTAISMLHFRPVDKTFPFETEAVKFKSMPYSRPKDRIRWIQREMTAKSIRALHISMALRTPGDFFRVAKRRLITFGSIHLYHFVSSKFKT